MGSSKQAQGGLLVHEVPCTQDLVNLWTRVKKACKIAYLSSQSSKGFPFCTPDLGGFIPCTLNGPALCLFLLISVLQKCLGAGGYDSQCYASNSFRIGDAMEAADEEVVKRIGQWDSDSFKLYVHPHFLLY